MYIECTERELSYLKSRDEKLGKAIDRYGRIKREMLPDIFTAAVKNIAGQQISNAALGSVWGRLCAALPDITPKSVAALSAEEIKGFGMSGRKAEYIREFALKVRDGEFDLDSLYEMSDRDAVKALCSLRGVGEWTAEMILIFAMGRRNILSCNDFGIKNGIKKLYGLEDVNRKALEKYREIYSPCCTAASFYLWAVSNDSEFL